MAQPPWKIVWWLLTELNIHMPYHSEAVLLGIHPKGLKTYVHTEIFTQTFIAALFITAKLWEQPTCSSVGKWIINSTHPGNGILSIAKKK